MKKKRKTARSVAMIWPASSIILTERISTKREQELQALSYQDYLKTIEWQTIKRYMRHLFPRCQICGSKYSLNVHHNNYPKRGRETIRDLLVLCDDCHHRMHFLRKARPQIQRAAETLIYLLDECGNNNKYRDVLLVSLVSLNEISARGCKASAVLRKEVIK